MMYRTYLMWYVEPRMRIRTLEAPVTFHRRSDLRVHDAPPFPDRGEVRTECATAGGLGRAGGR